MRLEPKKMNTQYTSCDSTVLSNILNLKCNMNTIFCYNFILNTPGKRHYNSVLEAAVSLTLIGLMLGHRRREQFPVGLRTKLFTEKV